LTQHFNLDGVVETVDVQMSTDDIIEAMHKDGEFFIQFFLADELKFPVPEFHIQSWNLITAEMILYIALALPRGHAKTTLSKLCCVWYLLFTDTRFIVYVSNTVNIAAEACKDIVANLRSDNFAKVFGAPRFEVDREGHGFYKFWLEVPDGRGGKYEKFCILKALGAGQQVRGLNIDNERPQLAVVDDLEDNDNTATPMLQKKLKVWFFGAFFKAMSKKRKKIIYLGNMLSNQSILYQLCEKSDNWHSIRKGALLSNGQPLWPEMWSFEDLQKDYLEYQMMGLTALWYAEMMNMPMAEGTSLILPEEITYLPPVIPGQQSTAFITLDPAISKNTWANDSAINVHAYVADRWQIVETVSGKFGPEQVFNILVELSLKWGTRVVGIEKGAYQLALKFIFEMLMKAYNQTFQIYEIPHKNVSKVERLTIWCAALKKRLWVLTEGDHVITQQLMAFDPLKTNNVDDVIDSCAMGPVMINCYMTEIMNQFKFTNEITPIRRVIGN
jgi:hypothetical protein